MCLVGGPPGKGDPFTIDDGAGSFVSTEVSAETALGLFAVDKYYTTSATGWSAGWSLGKKGEAFLPTPFGTSPQVNNSLQWWHSLYTFVMPRPGGWSVRYPTGLIANFSTCDASTTGCFAPVAADSREVTHKLFYDRTDGGGTFTLFRDNESRYVYASRWDSADGGTQRHFLTRIEPATYSTTAALATLTYAVTYAPTN